MNKRERERETVTGYQDKYSYQNSGSSTIIDLRLLPLRNGKIQCTRSKVVRDLMSKARSKNGDNDNHV